MDSGRSERAGPLGAGIAAGILLGIADWTASGLADTPASLALASLAGGALAGAIAGIVAALRRSPSWGPALVLAGGIALEGLSIASKELEGSARPLASALVLGCALAALVATLRQERAAGWSRAWLAGLLASLPAGALLAAWLARNPWVQLAGSAAPLAWLVLARVARARRATLALAWLALAAAFGFAQVRRPGLERPDLAPPAVAPEPDRPSIVLLVIDTLRADAVSPGGALADFARGGVEFRQCVSSAPWTLPAVGSLLTALYPSQHGAVNAGTGLAPEVATLAELLRAQGYATAAFTGGAFVGPAHRLDRGFEHFDARCERRFVPFGAHVPLAWRVAKNRYLPLRWLVRAVDESRGLEGVLDAARAWLARVPRRPAFVFLHTYQVHDYYLYDPDLDDAVLAARPPPSERFDGRLSVHPRELLEASQADLEHFRALYQARIAAVEQLFPALVRELASALGEDAIWVVTADHGEGFDAGRHRVHHGGRLHEDLLRVPLILRQAGRLAPRVVEEGVRTLDVLPTLLELAGIEVPAGLAGESLLPALAGARAFPASAFAEERAHGFDLLCLRRAGWKWIRGPARDELYRLAEDPLEASPLGHERPAELRAELEGFPARYPARTPTPIELDGATREHLRALGYGE